MLNLIGLDVHDFWFCWDFVISSLLSWGHCTSFPWYLGILWYLGINLCLETLNILFLNDFVICQGYHGSVSKFYFQHWSWWLNILATLKRGKMLKVKAKSFCCIRDYCFQSSISVRLVLSILPQGSLTPNRYRHEDGQTQCIICQWSIHDFQ